MTAYSSASLFTLPWLRSHGPIEARGISHAPRGPVCSFRGCEATAPLKRCSPCCGPPECRLPWLRSHGPIEAAPDSTPSAALTSAATSTTPPVSPSVLLDTKSDFDKKAAGMTNGTVPTFTGIATASAKVNGYRVHTESGQTPTLLGTALVTTANNAIALAREHCRHRARRHSRRAAET